jgi:nitrogen fixation NifU-like protein
MSDLRDLYQTTILDHNKQPRNFRVPEGANRQAAGHNPLCGDRVNVYVQLEDGVVKDIGFQGNGCAISTASASLMTQAVKGKSREEVDAIFTRFHDLVTGKHAPEPGEATAKTISVCVYPVLGCPQILDSPDPLMHQKTINFIYR